MMPGEQGKGTEQEGTGKADHIHSAAQPPPVKKQCRFWHLSWFSMQVCPLVEDKNDMIVDS